MSRSWPIVVGALAVGALIWGLVQDRAPPPQPAPPSPSAGSASLTPPPPPVPGVESRANPAPARPVLPALPPGDAGETLDDKFADEPVDPAWSARTERALAKPLAQVPTLKSVECHQTQCRVVFAGSERDIGKAVDKLESTPELHAIARTMILTAPTRHPDGTVELHTFLQIN